MDFRDSANETALSGNGQDGGLQRFSMAGNIVAVAYGAVVGNLTNFLKE